MLRKIARLIRKVQRLRLVDAQLAELRAQVEALRQAVAGRAEATGGLQGRLAEFRVDLGTAYDGSRAEVRALREAGAGAESYRCALEDQLAGVRQDMLRQGEQGRAETQALWDQLATLRKDVGRQRDQCDLLKSKIEVGPELFAEFIRWKARHPVPAEPLVSVCVATYNRAALLTGRCIPSVLEQTYPHLELIIVGDGCTDDTEARISLIQDPRLRFINLPRRGEYPDDPSRRWMVAGSQAGNGTLSLAKGDFVTHLDDDDEYLPGRLEKLVGFAASGGWDFVWHPFWCEPEAGRWAVEDATDLALGKVTTSSVFYRGWLKRLRWDPEAHLLDEPGDWNLFRRIKFLGASCARYPEPLLRHYAERNGEESNRPARKAA